jgi:ABC-2 type transport system ATP-binding protein
MRRRLDLAATLVASPPILFLDEPTTGLDPRSRLGLWEVIRQQAESCNTVFLTTQYLEEADRLANKIAIMDNGKVIREGSPQELKDCCGGDTHVRVRLLDRSRTIEAVDALRELGKEKIYGDPETGEVSLPAIGGASMLADIVRRMDASGIVLAELGLKQPTLDDVFLAITGHTVEEENEVN